MVKCGGFMGGDLGWEGGQFLSQLIKSEPPSKPKILEKVFVVVVVERDFSVKLWPKLSLTIKILCLRDICVMHKLTAICARCTHKE